MEAAAAFLAVRSRSVEETLRRLHHLGYPRPLCDHVIDRLITLGYLDDVAFARAWVESRDRVRPRGATALRRELQLKGISDDTIRAILDERAEAVVGEPAGAVTAEVLTADREAALRLLDRRGSTLRREVDPRRRRQKTYALLARNGFAPDICRELSLIVPAEHPDGGWGDV